MSNLFGWNDDDARAGKDRPEREIFSGLHRNRPPVDVAEGVVPRLAPSAAPRLIGEHVLKLIAHGDTIAISDLVASLEEDISKGGETAVYSEAAINALRSVRES